MAPALQGPLREKAEGGHLSLEKAEGGHLSLEKAEGGHLSLERAEGGHLSRERAEGGHLSLPPQQSSLRVWKVFAVSLPSLSWVC